MRDYPFHLVTKASLRTDYMIQREVFSFLFRTIREFSWEKPHSAGVGVSLPRSCPRGEMPALSGIILESSQKEAAWREKFGDKFLLERVGAFCSLGSHREHSLTTWETVGGCGDHQGGHIPAPLQHQVWGGTSASIKGTEVKIVATPWATGLDTPPFF